MAEKYAVTKEQLTDIADAIRLKRDTVAPMTVDEMPLEISLIDGGGGGVQAWGGEFTLSTNNHAITIPEGVFSKIAKTNSLIHVYCDFVSVDDTDTGYYVTEAFIFLSPNTRELENSSGTWKTTSRTTAKKADGTIKTMSQQQTGSRFTAFRASSNTFVASFNLDFSQGTANRKAFYFSTGNTAYKFKAGVQYKADWIYFGNDPENDIHTI